MLDNDTDTGEAVECLLQQRCWPVVSRVSSHAIIRRNEAITAMVTIDH